MRWIPFTLVLFLFGCEADYDVKLRNTDPITIIIGQIIDTALFHRVEIMQTTPYFDTVTDARVSDATVIITASNGESYYFAEIDTLKGVYTNTRGFYPEAGLNYTITVNDTYQAQGTMPEKCVIDSIKIKPLEKLGVKVHVPYVYAPAPARNTYFMFTYTVNNKDVTPKITQTTIMENKFLSGKYLNGLGIISGNIRNSLIDNASADKFSENTDKMIFVKSGDIATVYLSLIDEGYFSFVKQCKNSQSGENPMFGGSNTSISTNFTGGAQGYFSCRNIISLSDTIR